MILPVALEACLAKVCSGFGAKDMRKIKYLQHVV